MTRRLVRVPRRDLVSVIVPARNAAAILSGQLLALAGQDYHGRWEVVVVDDASTDATAELARGWARRLPRLVVVTSARRAGASAARNLGARTASGDRLLFCDADDQVCSGWVRAIVERLGEADAVGGRFDEARLNSPDVRGWRTPLERPGRPVGWLFLPFAASGNMGVWRDAFDAIGGFDERLRACEDMDFSWRLQLRGYRLDHAETAVVFYRHRPTLGAMARQQFRYGEGGAHVRRLFSSSAPRSLRIRPARQRWWRIARRLPDALTSRAGRGRLIRALAFEAGTVWGTWHAPGG